MKRGLRKKRLKLQSHIFQHRRCLDLVRRWEVDLASDPRTSTLRTNNAQGEQLEEEDSMEDYTLIRSKRKSLSIQIGNDGGLIARAPKWMPVFAIEAFIRAKSGWIEKHRSKIVNRKSWIERKIYSEKEIYEIKQRLGIYLKTRVEELWKGTWLPRYTSIRVTKSERRWGSCSAKNGLCFSYRLAEYLSPPVKEGCPKGQGGLISVTKNTITPLPPLSGGQKSDFIDAIIVHELAHLREKHHQKPFWNLVYSMMPEYETIMKNERNLF